ncbi:MAG: 5-(carboxyamino)imidazole ribonucleotide synthase [bacterium]|nr:5-(carboxyamino)imidazole ribonucleotide synthase [bacterium]
MMSLQPGDRVGIVGGGQLGRMAAFAAHRLGLRVSVLDPDQDCPASACADVTVASYSDGGAIEKMTRDCKLITFEFENLSADAIRQASCPVFPDPSVLETCQSRELEKNFLRNYGFPVPKFAFLSLTSSPQQIEEVCSLIGFPAVVKTIRMGYDGKGQWKVSTRDELQTVLQSITDVVILEQFVDFVRECSVIVARNLSGIIKCFPVVENRHANHILDLTIAPAPHLEYIAQQAEAIAVGIAEQLQLVGLLAVELFETQSGELLVNELAPRPHNSGHWSIEGAQCSQFEQLWRAVGNLPLGDSTPIAEEVAMANLLGELWHRGEPEWRKVLELPGIHLHLYGKREARPGRKMGHLTAVGKGASKQVIAARKLLCGK